jgi:hypothetical protein
MRDDPISRARNIPARNVSEVTLTSILATVEVVPSGHIDPELFYSHGTLRAGCIGRQQQHDALASTARQVR